MKNTTRDKERHYIVIKGSIQEEDITIANIWEGLGARGEGDDRG